MVGGIERGRLAEERKAWRKNHPHGFAARLETGPDGSVNLMVWHCNVPGKSGTDWEGGHYPLTMHFTEDYPTQPPKCMFPKGFFHINVYPSGDAGARTSMKVDLLRPAHSKSTKFILNAGAGWSPAITVKQILVGIQELLDQPNPSSSAQFDCNKLYTQDKAEYNRRVMQQAKQYPALF